MQTTVAKRDGNDYAMCWWASEEALGLVLVKENEEELGEYRSSFVKEKGFVQ
jgi:hypothetical protein